MKKNTKVAALLIIIMISTAAIYYAMLKVNYVELANYSNFLVPEKAELLEENGNFIAFTTDEVSIEGMKISYQNELKKKKWTVIEKSKNEFIWSPEQGHSVHVQVKNHQITIRSVDD